MNKHLYLSNCERILLPATYAASKEALGEVGTNSRAFVLQLLLQNKTPERAIEMATAAVKKHKSSWLPLEVVHNALLRGLEATDIERLQSLALI